jgi:hypothetical protein
VNVETFKELVNKLDNENFNTILVHPEVFMRFENPTRWQDFLDGFRNVLYILDCYDDGDEWGYGEFWESLSIGWMQEYIYPYDDPYNLTISPERKLRIAQELPKIIVSAEAYDELVRRINEPPDPAVVERIKELMNRKAPWDYE